MLKILFLLICLSVFSETTPDLRGWYDYLNQELKSMYQNRFEKTGEIIIKINNRNHKIATVKSLMFDSNLIGLKIRGQIFAFPPIDYQKIQSEDGDVLVKIYNVYDLTFFLNNIWHEVAPIAHMYRAERKGDIVRIFEPLDFHKISLFNRKEKLIYQFEWRIK